MDASALITALQAELRRHTWDTFVDEPPTVAHGGKGVVVVGCPVCRKTLYTVGQIYRSHRADVLPGVIRRAVTAD